MSRRRQPFVDNVTKTTGEGARWPPVRCRPPQRHSHCRHQRSTCAELQNPRARSGLHPQQRRRRDIDAGRWRNRPGNATHERQQCPHQCGTFLPTARRLKWRGSAKESAPEDVSSAQHGNPPTPISCFPGGLEGERVSQGRGYQPLPCYGR